METKDKIAIAALGISFVALFTAVGSAVFTAKQYRLNEARDQREREAALPVFEHVLEVKRVGRIWKVTVEAQNRTDVKLFVDVIFTKAPNGLTLALPEEPGKVEIHKNPTAAMTNTFPAGIMPRDTASWTGYLVIGDQEAGGTTKIATLLYAYHFAGEPLRNAAKTVSFVLP